ncbi:hypothetical protein AB0L40_04050 [Patulibacter sp. NPDC049589]|uniref:hypothetical protein n=1 Tax=Patulibacter sp. NPDC049589 TaxID=3154731 RepID=UPI003437BC1C
MSVPRPVLLLVCAVPVVGASGALSPSAVADDGKPPLTVRNDGVHALSRTVGGIDWTLRGAKLTVTVTRDAPRRIRRRILGHTLTAACAKSGRKLSELASTHTRAAFPRATGRTVSIALPRHLRRATACILEPLGEADDLVTVRFAPQQPPQGAL